MNSKKKPAIKKYIIGNEFKQSVSVCVAPRDSGKTTCVSNIIIDIRKKLGIKQIFAMNGSEKQTLTYTSIIGAENVASSYSYDILSNITQKQVRKKQLYVEYKALLLNYLLQVNYKEDIGSSKKIDKKYLLRIKQKFWNNFTREEKNAFYYLLDVNNTLDLCIVLDDLTQNSNGGSGGSKNSAFKNQIIQEIIFNGRHSFITIVILVHDFKVIEQKLRDCIDFVFLFNKYITQKDSKYLYENFGSKILPVNMMSGNCLSFLKNYSIGKLHTYFQEMLNVYTQNYYIFVFSMKFKSSNKNVLQYGRLYKANVILVEDIKEQISEKKSIKDRIISVSSNKY